MNLLLSGWHSLCKSPPPSMWLGVLPSANAKRMCFTPATRCGWGLCLFARSEWQMPLANVLYPCYQVWLGIRKANVLYPCYQLWLGIRAANVATPLLPAVARIVATHTPQCGSKCGWGFAQRMWLPPPATAGARARVSGSGRCKSASSMVPPALWPHSPAVNGAESRTAICWACEGKAIRIRH
jgi:hypothetical protein